jgi:7,8-dihydropterin-6-yl-methyl-4-(beta-D-ribofuranosyl)aminobenzene 5'-phosphate synthase
MEEVDEIRITAVVENHVDMLLSDGVIAGCPVSRLGLAFHFDPKGGIVWSESGLSLLIEVFKGSKRHVLLFDTSLTPEVLFHNLELLKFSPSEIDHIIVSHGHPDHYGGLLAILKKIGRRIPVSIHDDAFVPSYVTLANGDVITFYNSSLPSQEGLEDAGARLVRNTAPLPIFVGTITSGEIERSQVEFEADPPPEKKGITRLVKLREGALAPDPVVDEQDIIANLKNRGLVIIKACGHSGMIHSVLHARKVTGVDRVYAIFGGFHLGFPGAPQERIEKTVRCLKEIEPAIVCPMHCSGFQMQTQTFQQMPEQFLLSSAGMQVVLRA